MSRLCGACTACCTVMAVDELSKPAYQACGHLDAAGRGCAIYDQRPAPCRGFLCFWLAEADPRARELSRVGRWELPLLLREDERPDQSGVMLHTAPESSLAKRGVRLLHAREVWPGAFGMPKGAQLLERLARTHLLALGPGDETEPLVGPPEKVRQVRALLAEMHR